MMGDYHVRFWERLAETSAGLLDTNESESPLKSRKGKSLSKQRNLDLLLDKGSSGACVLELWQSG